MTPEHPGAPAAGAQPSAPMGPGTLGRQLVIRVVLLVTTAAVLLSGATSLATAELLRGQVDQQLETVTDRLRRGGTESGGGPGGGLLQPGQPIGTLYATFDAGGNSLGTGQLAERGQRPTLPDEATRRLGRVPANRTKETIDLGGPLGRYRVVAYEATIVAGGAATPGIVVVGVPTALMDRTLARLIALEIGLSLLAMAGAAVVARTLVERSLRPLNRVAATAQQVSQLPLDRGEVALAIRVPPQDADPTTEVGRVGQAFNHMLSNVDGALAARQASEMKVRQFVADASHELRNPLAAIRGYAELTRRSPEELPADAAYAMARVESEAERMSQLVEDLLLLARLDSGPALDLTATDLTELVLNAVSDARAAGPQHSWALELPEEPVVALGDKNRLHQVVVNLLANARTHTPPGTLVETALSVDADRAIITVTDNGPGIPTEIADQVFERFTRADTSRVRAAGAGRGASTGLGLAIVAAVTEAHRGTVAVQSRPGRTRFTVALPLAPARSTAEAPSGR